MLSNVMGPQREARLLGQPIDAMHFHALAPIGIYFGIITYNGAASAGLTTTPETCPDPEALAGLWVPAWEELRAAVAAAVEGGEVLKQPLPKLPREVLATASAALVLALAVLAKGALLVAGCCSWSGPKSIFERVALLSAAALFGPTPPLR
jgi:hypothetical protein